jgi:hypothetical protein
MVSAAGELYSRGQKWPVTGVYADMGFEIDGPGLMIFEFPFMGLVSIPTDVAVPSITYNATQPPKAESVALAIGAWATPVVRKVGFKANRKASPRANINNPGHAGFSPGHRDPQLTITVEAAALATFDPYTLRDNATPQLVTFTVGATQYNKIKFTAAQAQIIEVAEERDEDTALWTLTFTCPPSNNVLNDDYSLQWL